MLEPRNVFQVPGEQHGDQTGSKFWEFVRDEYDIDPIGRYVETFDSQLERVNVYYNEVSCGDLFRVLFSRIWSLSLWTVCVLILMTKIFILTTVFLDNLVHATTEPKVIIPNGRSWLMRFSMLFTVKLRIMIACNVFRCDIHLDKALVLAWRLSWCQKMREEYPNIPFFPIITSLSFFSVSFSSHSICDF